VIRYILRRVLLVLPALFGLLVLTFVMLRVVPSDPAAALAGDNATAEQIAEIRRAYGFDRPLYEQLGVYLFQVARGDFGVSAYTGRPVGEDVAQRLPATIELTLLALLFATVMGIAIGTLAAIWHNRPFDHAVRIVSVAGLAIASFWAALMLQLLFAMELGWLPLYGRLSAGHPIPPSVTGLLLVDSLIAGRVDTFVDALRHIAMPAFTLSLASLATIARFTRASMLETLQRDFVTYERAAGYSRRRIIVPYALRNSLITPVTQIGLLFGALISGAVAIEAVFNWPGLGYYLVQAILASDYKAILAVTLVIGLVYAIVNIVTDVVHGLVDPRIADQN
jgi:peptide/nickel transport system permease protein